mgnify:FL=1
MYFHDDSQLYSVIGKSIKRYRTAAHLTQTQFVYMPPRKPQLHGVRTAPLPLMNRSSMQ